MHPSLSLSLSLYLSLSLSVSLSPCSISPLLSPSPANSAPLLCSSSSEMVEPVAEIAEREVVDEALPTGGGNGTSSLALADSYSA